MKKKLLIMFCSLTALALFIIGSFHFYSAQKEAQYATTAIPYIEQVIPELSKWEPEISRQYLSAEFLQKTSADDFARIIKAMSKVGELQGMEVPEFEEIYSGDTPAGEKQTVISYQIKARYTSGDAIIIMSLLDRDGAFEVYRFNVQSEALAR